MLNRVLCLFLLFTVFFSISAQQTIYSTSYLRYFSGTFSSIESPLVLPTSQGGYYLVSSINSPPTNTDTDFLVLKLSSKGQQELSASFRGPGSVALKDAAVGPNDQLYILGYMQSASTTVVVTKLTSSLDIDSVIPLSINLLKDSSMRLILANNGLHMILAAMQENRGLLKVFMSRMSNTGLQLFSKEISLIGQFPQIFELRSLRELQDGNILVGGNILINDNLEIFIFKLDSAGNQVWMKKFGGVSDHSLNSIIEAKDQSAYYFTGYRGPEITLTPQNWVLVGKISTDGLIQTAVAKEEGISDGYALVETDDGRIIVVGSSQNGETGIDFFVGALNLNLVPIEVKEFQRSVDDSLGRNLILNSDGTVVIGGLNAEGQFIAQLDTQLSLCSDFKQTELAQSELPNPTTLQEITTAGSYFAIGLGQISAASSISMTKQTQSVAQVRSKAAVCDVYDELSTISILPQLSDNECKCSQKGNCVLENGLCTCDEGYQGFHCQYLTSEKSNIATTLNRALWDIYTTYQLMPAEDAVQFVKDLTPLPDLVTTASGLECMSMLVDILSTSFSQSNLQGTFEVQSNLSQMSPSDAQEAQLFSTQLTNTNSDILSSYLGSITEISTDLIKVKVDSLDTSTGQPSSFSPSAAISVTIPSSASSCSGSTKTTAITYSSNVYQHLTASEQRMVSDLASLNIFCDGQTESISNLSSPISIEFQISSSNSAAQEVLAKIASGEWTEQQVIDAGFFNCNYYDPNTQSFSSEGTRVVQIKTSSFVCETTHLTDFAPFFNSGAQVLLSSNYNVWYALKYVSLTSLGTNVGFYVTFAYWGSLVVLGFLCGLIDKSRIKGNFFIALFDSTRSEEDQGYPSNPQSCTPELILSISPDDRSTTNNSISIFTKGISLPGEAHLVKDLSTQEVGVTTKVTRIRPSLKSTFSQGINFSKLNKKKKKKSTCQEVQSKIESSIAYSKQKRRCCCTCCCMAKNELTTNNQMFNLCCKTSPLYPRFTRLALIQLAILCDLTICALFFNIDPQRASSSLLFWDNLVENIWCGLYSALIAIPLMLIVALAFRVPPSYVRRLEKTNSVKEIIDEYRIIAPRLQCQRACAYVLFTVLSFFFCVYLIAFGELVRAKSSQNWVQSSGASLTIDLVAFEIIPAFCVGTVALFSQGCQCKGWLWMLVLIEVYRILRNVAA